MEYSNIHDVDATMIQPEWHGWMHHVFDETPEEARQLGFSAEAITDHSHVPFFSNTGATNPVDMKEQHNTSQYRYLYYNLFLSLLIFMNFFQTERFPSRVSHDWGT